MHEERPRHDVVKLPRFQRQLVDWLDLNTGHPFYMIFEVDVTSARRYVREIRSRTGRPLSLTAFISSCFAAAIAENRMLQAYKKGRRRIAVFEDVDLAIAVEHNLEGAKIPLPAIVRRADQMSPLEIDDAIREARAGQADQAWALRWLGPWLLLPSFLRRFILRRLLANPIRRKRLTGTAMVSASGMFAHGAGWGISPPSYTVSLLTGSLAKKPYVVNESLQTREILGITMCFDHDIVDGAVATRFAQRFKEMIEDCRQLRAAVEAPPSDSEMTKASAAKTAIA